jgi:N-acetylglucosaminyldiphosphoundecaprenol N-acetyl-beta-D-mannosaminyltransferase
MSRIFGVRLDHVATEAHLRDRLNRALHGDRAMRIFTPNPEILLHARADPTYAETLRSADLALPDGTGVAVIESLRAGRRVRRWPGVEIGELLVRIAAERDLPIAFVGGGAGDVAERAAEHWRRRLPAVRIAVAGDDVPISEDGLVEPASNDLDLTGAVAAIAPAIVLVGFGAPKQERWIARHADSVPTARIMIGVGGTFDIWADERRRASTFLRRLGLEWAWRLAIEPRRWPRIFRATIVFPVRVLLDRSG